MDAALLQEQIQERMREGPGLKFHRDTSKCIAKLMDLFVETAISRTAGQLGDDEQIVTGDHVRAIAKSLFLDFH